MRAAIGQLRATGQRAIWGMHSRCSQHGSTDFAACTRMYRALAEPVLTYGSEVWGPDLLTSLQAALRASGRQWDCMVAPSGLLRSAFLGDHQLARSLDPPRARRTWSRACLHAIGWLADDGCGPGGPLRSALGAIQRTLSRADTLPATKLKDRALGEWDLAYQGH